MKLINIGFGNLVSASRLIAIVSPESAPIKRIVQDVRERGELIDATYGRRTRAVIIMDSGHVILSALQPETVSARMREGRGMKRGKLLVISGPSGCGKSTVIGKMMAGRENVEFSVSATTRRPRPGEREGVDYFFVSRERGEEMLRNDELLEHAEFVGNCYGTPKSQVCARLESGVSVILDIEVQGAAQVKQKLPEAVTVFLAPPGLDALERRLRGRGTESEETIRARLDTARREMALAPSYDYTVINDDPDRASRELGAILDK